jgi:hypothetical protein
MKKILFMFALLAILAPLSAQAQIDQRCWKQAACKEAGGTFYQGADSNSVCGQKNSVGELLGFCLPVGTIDTAISFGGQKSFTNIGAFINFIYRYGVTIAGVLAVVMIIIAGVQWTLSAGSPERIGAAKKRIAGASVGVLLAVLSYVLLNTVNPYLVNIRLPQVWMINQQGLAPPRCDQVRSGQIAYAGKEGEQIDKSKAVNANYLSANDVRAQCGYEYYVEGTGGQTCLGTLCPTGDPYVCYKGLEDKTNVCHKASIAGIGFSTSFSKELAEKAGTLGWAADAIIGDGWTFEWFDTPHIYAVCKNGETEEVSPVGTPASASASRWFDEEKLLVEYRVAANEAQLDSGKTECATEGGLRGYALYLEFDEVGDGDDEEMFIGRNKQTGEQVNLGEDNVDDEILSRDVVNQYLFTKEELLKGYHLEINVDKVCDVDSTEDRKKCYAHIGGYGEKTYDKTKEKSYDFF